MAIELPRLRQPVNSFGIAGQLRGRGRGQQLSFRRPERIFRLPDGRCQEEQTTVYHCDAGLQNPRNLANTNFWFTWCPFLPRFKPGRSESFHLLFRAPVPFRCLLDGGQFCRCHD